MRGLNTPPKRRYSRLAKREQKKNLKSAGIYLGLTILLIVFALYFGLPSIVKVSAFLTDLRDSSLPVEITDTTPPAPPSLDLEDEFAQKSVITVRGRSEAGVKIFLYLNDKLEAELVTDVDGGFATNLPILAGENTLYAVAEDEAGNKSSESRIYTITYDKKAPKLVISEPANGASFNGSGQRDIAIKGETEVGAQVLVNGRFATVDSEGFFEIRMRLSEGNNVFEVVAEDEAGNEAKETFSVAFAP